MFAKHAQFRVRFGAFGHCSGAGQTPCNDNRRDRDYAAALPRNVRPVLVCRWQEAAQASGLACSWQSQAADASASEEPAIGSPFDPLRRLRRGYWHRAAGAAAGVRSPYCKIDLRLYAVA